MNTLSRAYEFAGIAADEIMVYLRPALADGDISEAVPIIRECCVAAIVSALVQQRWEAPTVKQASK